MALYPEPSPRIPQVTHLPGPTQGDWTYEDYARLPEDGKRYEIMNGNLLTMSPSPTRSHQHTVSRICLSLYTHINSAGLGEVIIAPFDVELTPRVVVQPDVLVVLEKHLHRLTESRLRGAPDLAVEVASPGTASYDRREKYQAYLAAGVPEYWLVDPRARSVEVLTLDGVGYRVHGLYQGQAILSSPVIPTLQIPIEPFFIPTSSFE